MTAQDSVAKILGDFFGQGVVGALKAIFWRAVPHELTSEIVSAYLRTAVFEYFRTTPSSRMGVNVVVQPLRALALQRAGYILAVGPTLARLTALGDRKSVV